MVAMGLVAWAVDRGKLLWGGRAHKARPVREEYKSALVSSRGSRREARTAGRRAPKGREGVRSNRERALGPPLAINGPGLYTCRAKIVRTGSWATRACWVMAGMAVWRALGAEVVSRVWTSARFRTLGRRDHERPAGGKEAFVSRTLPQPHTLHIMPAPLVAPQSREG